MDELRRDRCLCLQCDFLKSCDLARTMFILCKDHDMALAVTRCKQFDSGEKNESVVDKGEMPQEDDGVE
jgi:hypothetical protein